MPLLRTCFHIIRTDFHQILWSIKCFSWGDSTFFTHVINFRKCPGWYEISTVFYRKALHRRRMEILADPSIFHQKHQITPAKFSISKTKFWNLFYIIRKRPPDRDKPLRTLFSSSEMSQMSKKTVFFSQNLDFAWYFMVFLVRTSYTAADTLTTGGSTDRILLR